MNAAYEKQGRSPKKNPCLARVWLVKLKTRATSEKRKKSGAQGGGGNGSLLFYPPSRKVPQPIRVNPNFKVGPTKECVE